MTMTQNLPKTQAKALEILTAAGELERTAFQLAGANGNAIDSLERKGLIIGETRDFLNELFFSGPEIMSGRFYRVA